MLRPSTREEVIEAALLSGSRWIAMAARSIRSIPGRGWSSNAQETSTAPHFEVVLEPSANCGDWLGSTMGISGDGFDVRQRPDLRDRQVRGRPALDRHPSRRSRENIAGRGVLEPQRGLDLPDHRGRRLGQRRPRRHLGACASCCTRRTTTLVILHDQTGSGVSGLQHDLRRHHRNRPRAAWTTFIERGPAGDLAAARSGPTSAGAAVATARTSCSTGCCTSRATSRSTVTRWVAARRYRGAVGDTLMTHKSGGCNDIDIDVDRVGARRTTTSGAPRPSSSRRRSTSAPPAARTTRWSMPAAQTLPARALLRRDAR